MIDAGAPPLRIAHVDAERGFSGGEVQVFLLIEGLATHGHDNLLLCPPGSRAEAEAKRRAIAVAAVPMRNAVDLVASWRLARAIKAANVDLVHLHTGRAAWLGGAAARLAGVPKSVLERAKEILRNLEESELTPEGNVRQSNRRQRDREKLKQLAPAPQMDLFR